MLKKACVFLHKKGITCVVVTLGEKRRIYISLKGKGVCQSAGLNLGPIVDKTGAGRCFLGGTFIAKFTEEEIPLSKLKLDDVRRHADCANIAAALSITRRGGIRGHGHYARAVQKAVECAVQSLLYLQALTRKSSAGAWKTALPSHPAA